jgi:RNA polymerase sigma-70 factor (ECF subfamily)
MTTPESGASNERALIRRFLRDRREDAFCELYRLHTPRLYLLARRMLGRRHSEAEDVVQETWIRATKHLQDFEWRSSLSTWLGGIAINCSRETLRRLARRNESAPDNLEELEPAGNIPSPTATLDLENAIARLPDGYREVLVLHDVEGFTHEEVARHLGIETGTSKSQLSRARGKLRTNLSGGKREEI